jgi:hypothetical protein
LSLRAGALALAALAACVSPAERDAEHVLAAIERVRDSDGGTRASQLDALESLHTEVPAADKARLACAAAYRALDNAQKLITAAKAGGVDRGKIEAAQAELATARARIVDCTTSTTELRRWLKKN